MYSTITNSKDLAEALSYWATTAGILVAIVAGLAAYWKHTKDLKLHEWDRARGSYEKFVDLAIEHPEFSAGCWKTLPADSVAQNQYRWFMARFMWACEEVLAVTEHDENWRGALKSTMIEHMDYITSTVGRSDSDWYYPPVQRLIKETELEARQRGLL